jgi:hypothetical protein
MATNMADPRVASKWTSVDELPAANWPVIALNHPWLQDPGKKLDASSVLWVSPKD